MPDETPQPGALRRLWKWSAGPVAMCIWLAPFVLTGIYAMDAATACRCRRPMVFHIFEHDSALIVYSAMCLWDGFDSVPKEYVHRGAALTNTYGPTARGAFFPTRLRFDALHMHHGLDPTERRDVEAQVARHIRGEYATNQTIPDRQTPAGSTTSSTASVARAIRSGRGTRSTR